MSPGEHDLIFNHFEELFQEVYMTGYVEESSYDHLGFLRDFEVGKEGVERDIGIKREHMHCAKPLSHPEQVILRDCLQEKCQKKENNQLKRNADKEMKDIE
eukprot:6336322-Ditylum_brightwellii.AAC.1